MKPVSNLAGTLRGKSLLIFDFDGTVADTTPLHAAAFSEVLAPLGIEVDYSCIAGLRTLDAMRQCLSGVGRVLDESELAALVTAKQQSVRNMISHTLQPLPGVDAFLRWARSRYRLAMVTSGSRGTVSLALGQLGYTGWFDPLICADDVQKAKPDPEGFLAVIERSGLSAKQALIFEDSVAGFDAANSAEIDYCDVRSNLFTSWKSDATNRDNYVR
jgi:HAD superfamily hydrolase (TIGR01509 family)